jgi:protein-export membrane protein SecD
MKRCPTCSRVYDDMSLRFCLDDGTELVDKPAEEQPATLVLPAGEQPQPTMKAFEPPPPPPVSAATMASSGSQRKLIIWIFVIGLGLPLLAGILDGACVMTRRQPLVWHLVLEVDPRTPDLNTAVSQTTEIIKSRLNAIGIRNFEVRPQGNAGQIAINLPNVRDPERVKQLITDYGKLEIVHVITPPSPMPVQTYATREEAIASLNSTGAIPANRRVLPYPEREETTSTNKKPPLKWVIVESPAIINGSDLRNASAVPGYANDYQISFALNKAGAAKFGSWTGANINEYMGVVLNDEVKSVAYIKAQIFDSGEITGRFTKQHAEDLALVLRAGALPAPVRLIEEKVDQ